MGKPSQAALDAVLAELPEELRDALVDRVLAERRERKMAERVEAADENGASQRPDHHLSFREVVSGRSRRRLAPVAKAEDRQYVPAALRHWRNVHGLNTRAAQERIGYSPRSSIWRHWEAEFIAPPYLALVKMLAVTGIDPAAAVHDPAMGMAADLRLDAMRAEHRAMLRARRRRR